MRAYVNMPDDLWRAINTIAKGNGLTFAGQVKVYLLSIPEVKAQKSAAEKDK